MEEQPKEGEAEVAEHWFSKWERQCLAEVEQPQRAAGSAPWPDGDSRLKGEGILTLPRPLRRAWGLGPFPLLGRCDHPQSSVMR